MMIKFLVLLFWLIVSSLSSNIKLRSNRYEGVVIAINPKIKEDSNLIEGLKDIWTDASSVLWNATNHRAYFGNITILVPRNWNGSYNNARLEVYDKADILVATKSSKYGDTPYTLQYGGCGTPGEYIHLTPNYILNNAEVVDNYGPKGKVMIHEWAHLRWGVFDENPTEEFDQFYYDKDGIIQATRSPLSLEGISVIIKDGEVTNCQATAQSNWLPENGCVFIPNEVQDERLNCSLLSHQYRDEAVTFCHDNEDDPINLHNYAAPNEHNRLCNERSVWDVIMSSVDFENDANMPNPSIKDVTPTFNVVKAVDTRIVLVLDTSGSMGGTRFDHMLLSAKTLIEEYTSNGIKVGIVEFETTAKINSNLSSTETDEDRQKLVDSLPTSTGGGTCIGCGIETGVEVLKQAGFAAGGQLIVLTDGEENGYLRVKDVHDETVHKEVVINSLYLGPTVNEDLLALTEATGGMMLANSLDNLLKLIESFIKLADPEDGDVSNKRMQIHSETHEVHYNRPVSKEVYIDSTVGRDTIFSFTWSQHADVGISVCITKPNPNSPEDIPCSTPIDGCDIKDQSPPPHQNFTVDTNYKTIKYTEPGVAEAGNWVYRIKATCHDQNVSVMVTTKAADEDILPIVVKPSVSATDVTGGQYLVINAMVTFNNTPILGAIVEASVTNTIDGTVIPLELWDEGGAPDVRKHDGVYSRCFTQYSSQGKYSVKVTATGTGNDSLTFASSYGSPASFNYGYVDSNGNVVLNPKVADMPDTNTQSGTTAQQLEVFKRIETAGSFTYSGPEYPGDVFPPSKVIDLVARQHDSLDYTEGIDLTFTAPGDDFDYGRASSYEIGYSYVNSRSLSTSFASAIPVKNSQLIIGDLSKPNEAGTKELFIFKITDLPENVELLTIAFAIRATDDVGNIADVSNIAMMNLFLAPPQIACTDKKGNLISGKPFQKPNDCTHFYQCSNGKLHEKPCAKGTVFNPDIGVCDHPYNVASCGNTDESEGSGTDPPITQPPVPEKPSCEDANGKPMTTGPLPYPNDCTKFYQCSHGIVYETACPSGLLFNPTYSVCDWPQNVPGC